MDNDNIAQDSIRSKARLVGTVYLLHFLDRINPGSPCRHYLGFAEELMPRLHAHRFGHGARLTQVANERGIGFELVRAWKGSRRDERRLKNQHNGPRFCPLCNDRPRSPDLEEIRLESEL
jgi:hypothetical protein